MIDLHTHSTASDGTLTPREVVLLAAAQGLSAVALTDHDTAAGNAEALDAGREAGIRVIPGIEMSAVWEGTEIHILGYFADPDDDGLTADLSWFRDRREERNDIILDNLAEDGILITREELTGGNPDTVITRAHFAKVLMDRGLVRDRNRAELMAWRISRFSREETLYWFAKTSSSAYGKSSIEWAKSGLRVMLAGQQTNPKEVERLLTQLRK